MLLPVAHQLAASIFVVENVGGDAGLALLDLGASAQGAVLSALRDVKIEVADAPARLIGSSLQRGFDGDPCCLVLMRYVDDHIHGPLRKISSSSRLWTDFLAVLFTEDLGPSHGAIDVELGLVRAPFVDLPKLEHNFDLVVGLELIEDLSDFFLGEDGKPSVHLDARALIDFVFFCGEFPAFPILFAVKREEVETSWDPHFAEVDF